MKPTSSSEMPLEDYVSWGQAVTVEDALEYPVQHYDAFEDIPESLRIPECFMQWVEMKPQCFVLIPDQFVDFDLRRCAVIADKRYLRLFYSQGCPDYEDLAIAARLGLKTIEFVEPQGVSDKFLLSLPSVAALAFLDRLTSHDARFFTPTLKSWMVKEGILSTLMLHDILMRFDRDGHLGLCNLITDQDLERLVTLDEVVYLKAIGRPHVLINVLKNGGWIRPGIFHSAGNRPDSLEDGLFRFWKERASQRHVFLFATWLALQDLNEVLSFMDDFHAGDGKPGRRELSELLPLSFASNELIAHFIRYPWLKPAVLLADMGI